MSEDQDYSQSFCVRNVHHHHHILSLGPITNQLYSQHISHCDIHHTVCVLCTVLYSQSKWISNNPKQFRRYEIIIYLYISWLGHSEITLKSWVYRLKQFMVILITTYNFAAIIYACFTTIIIPYYIILIYGTNCIIWVISSIPTIHP